MGREFPLDLQAVAPEAGGGPAFQVWLNGRGPSALQAALDGDAVLLRLEGRLWRVVLGPALPGAHPSLASVRGETIPVDLEVEGAPGRPGTKSYALGPLRVTSTMPGRVVALRVSVGDLVERGDLLLTLEAMKMQNEFTAPAPGRILRLPAPAGHVVAAGDVLAEIGPAPPGP